MFDWQWSFFPSLNLTICHLASFWTRVHRLHRCCCLTTGVYATLHPTAASKHYRGSWLIAYRCTKRENFSCLLLQLLVVLYPSACSCTVSNQMWQRGVTRADSVFWAKKDPIASSSSSSLHVQDCLESCRTKHPWQGLWVQSGLLLDPTRRSPEWDFFFFFFARVDPNTFS